MNMIKRKVLSPSSISLFLDCPRCFWLQFNKGIRRPSGPFPSLPAGMDRILKNHFDKHREAKTKPNELDGIEGHLFGDMDKLNLWRNNFRGLRYEDRSTGFTLMGALDDLFVIKNKYAPLDFKTRGYPLKEDTHKYYQHQMDIYSFLLEKNGLKANDFAILLFYHPKCVNSHCNVEFNSDIVKVPVNKENGKKVFIDAVKCILGKEPKSDGCVWCKMSLTSTKL